MKVTLVNPDTIAADPYWKGSYFVGIGMLSAVLRKQGHDTSLIHITDPGYSRQDFFREIEADGGLPDLFAFSCTTIGFLQVRRCLLWLKEEGIHVPTICGGAHPSVDAEKAIQVEGLDMICLGEGEEALCELVDALEKGKPYHEIQNLWVKHEGQVYKNPLRPLIQDLDSLPFPDRKVWKNWRELFWERRGMANLIASRGCPFKCTYCVNHTYMELFPDKQYVRFRSPDNVIAEMKEILATYPNIEGFNFDDDILYMRRNWSLEFTEKYKKEIGLPFYCNMRPNVCKPDIVSALKEAGCMLVRVGLESGSEYIRNTLLKRELKEEDMVTAFHRLQKAGIPTFSFNMIGLPFETPANVLETVKLNVKAKAAIAQIWIFYPFPGTELKALCEENGFMRKDADDIYGDLHAETVLDITTMTKTQILTYRDAFVSMMEVYTAIEKLPAGVRVAVEKLADWFYQLPFFPLLYRYGRQPRRVYNRLLRPIRTFLRQRKYPKLHPERALMSMEWKVSIVEAWLNRDVEKTVKRKKTAARIQSFAGSDDRNTFSS